nr:transposase [Peterkaempfera griseoplana]
MVDARRLELLLADPATAPHTGGVLVLDDSGDRKAGTATAHVGKQYLGSVGKIDRGVVSVTSCWADERVYYPVHACPYTPAPHFAGGRNDPAFRTKLQIAADLARKARDAGLVSPGGRRSLPRGAARGRSRRSSSHRGDAGHRCRGRPRERGRSGRCRRSWHGQPGGPVVRVARWQARVQADVFAIDVDPQTPAGSGGEHQSGEHPP